MHTTSSRHGPSGYRGAMRAAARQVFTRQRHEVVNSNINLGEEKCAKPPATYSGYMQRATGLPPQT